MYILNTFKHFHTLQESNHIIQVSTKLYDVATQPFISFIYPNLTNTFLTKLDSSYKSGQHTFQLHTYHSQALLHVPRIITPHSNTQRKLPTLKRNISIQLRVQIQPTPQGCIYTIPNTSSNPQELFLYQINTNT